MAIAISDGSHYEKRGKAEPTPIDVPFDIPDSWEWVRVSSVFNLVRGSGIKRTEITASGKPCVRYGELYTTYTMDITQVASHTTSEVYKKAQKLLDNEIIVTLTGENDIDIGRAIVNNTGEIIAFGGDLLALKGGYIDGRFAALCMNSSYMGLQRTAAASGNIIVHLSANKIGSFLMAIPPVQEQKRIVARINELTPLIARYGALEDERETLDAALPDQLRKSILQQAVEGKLVPQDPDDESASILLERIREEKQQLIAEGKCKAPKGGESVIYRASDGGYYEKFIDAKGRESDPVCIDDEIPFDIPENWEWCRVGSIGDWKAGATPAKSNPAYHLGGTIPWLLTGNLNDGHVSDIPNMITQKALEDCSVRLNPVGAVLVAMYGATIGKIGILDIPATTNQACCACIPYSEAITKWLFTWLMFQKPYFVKMGEGGAQPNISRDKIVNCLFPIPPAQEQKRIVAHCCELLDFIG